MQLIINGLIAGSLAALLAGGLALVYGVLGIFNLSLGQMALIAGYSVWWFHQSLGLPLTISIPAGIIVCALVTWVSFEIFVRPFHRRHRFLPLVTTIALSMMLDAAILLVFGERPRTILEGSKHFMEFVGLRMNVEQMLLVGGTLQLLCIAAYVLHATKLGRQIRASTQHSDAAQSLGISSDFLYRLIFISSGVLAGLGGIFLGIDQTLSPTLGFSMTIKAYAALIAGGKDNLWGAVLCAYLIAILEQFAVGIPWFGGAYISASYQSVVALLFIVFFLLLRPQGMFGTLRRIA